VAFVVRYDPRREDLHLWAGGLPKRLARVGVQCRAEYLQPQLVLGENSHRACFTKFVSGVPGWENISV